MSAKNPIPKKSSQKTPYSKHWTQLSSSSLFSPLLASSDLFFNSKHPKHCIQNIGFKIASENFSSLSPKPNSENQSQSQCQPPFSFSSLFSISPLKFLTIFYESMPTPWFARSHAQPSPQMDSLEVMSNPADWVTPNRPIILPKYLAHCISSMLASKGNQIWLGIYKPINSIFLRDYLLQSQPMADSLLKFLLLFIILIINCLSNILIFY